MEKQMKTKAWPLAAALALGLAPPVLAADPIGYVAPDGVNTVPVATATPLPASPPPSSAVGTVTAAAVGTSSATVLAPGARRLLAIDNESTTATIACAFGAAAAINTAGSFTIPPGQTRMWKDYPVPADAVNCIANAAATPATVEVN
jgi:hypothetical protein